MTEKPKLTDAEKAELTTRLHKAFLCPICGKRMTHYRLRGYKCHNEEHNERVAQMTWQEREKLYDAMDENGEGAGE